MNILEQIDAHMGDHMKFLNKHYKENKFIVSGRKVPRTGGIILVLAKSKEEVEAIMAENPFCSRHLEEITITEFQASQSHADLKRLLKIPIVNANLPSWFLLTAAKGWPNVCQSLNTHFVVCPTIMLFPFGPLNSSLFSFIKYSLLFGLPI